MEVRLRIKQAPRQKLRELAQAQADTEAACIASIFQVLVEPYRELLSREGGFSFFYPADVETLQQETFVFSEEQGRILAEFASILTQQVQSDAELIFEVFLMMYLESPEETLALPEKLRESAKRAFEPNLNASSGERRSDRHRFSRDRRRR